MWPTSARATTTHASGTAAADGSFSFDIAPLVGNNVLVVTSTAPNGGTAQAVRTVVNDVVQGTLLFDSTDPTGDDNGPGNYAYPTSSDFHAGAYDLTDFQVYDTGTTVTFRVQTRDLTPTFGSPLGAQLVDVYVHQPGASSTSTAASFATRNYTIAPDSAWSRLLEVQGFGQRFVDASNTNTVGTITISANQISRYITFSVDKTALGGTPASGWAFTVVLTGQDGFSPDQARGFQSTPQPLPVRRVCHGQLRPTLHRRPDHGAEGRGRSHPGRRHPVRRAGLHDSPARGDQRGGHPVATGGRHGGGTQAVLGIVPAPAATATRCGPARRGADGRALLRADARQDGPGTR